MKGEKKLLCLNGGGLKGIFQIDLFLFLENEYKKNNLYNKNWIINSCDVLVGTSIGSLLVLFILLQYSIKEIKIIFDDISLKIFKQSFLMKYLGKDFISLFKNPYDNDLLLKILNEYITNSPLAKKIRNNEIILDDLKDLNGDNFRFYHLNQIYKNKEFYVFSLQANGGNIQIFTNKTENTDNCNFVSDVRIIDAVLSSSAIPFYLKTRRFKICNKYNFYLDGAVGGLNCPSHIGILNKKDNYRVLILNASSIDKTFNSKGIGGLLYMLGTPLGPSSTSHSELISYILTDGKLRSIYPIINDEIKIIDPFSIKDYANNKEYLKRNGYYINLLNKNSSENNLFNLKNNDPNRFLIDKDWITDFFFNK